MANILTNGTFDNGNAVPWSYTDQNRVQFVTSGGCNTGAAGDGCVLFSNRGIGGMLDIAQLANDMEAGHEYTLSFYAKRTNRYDVWAGYDYWTLDGGYHTTHFASKESSLINNQYVKLTYKFVWPYNVMPIIWLRIRVGADASDGNSTVRIDNIVLDDGYPVGYRLDPYISGNFRLNDEQMEQNARAIYKYLRYRGWSKNAICGMLGNFQIESRCNPGAWGDYGTPDPATRVFGLAQWKYGSKYIDYWATPHGYADYDLKGQLECLDANTREKLWGQYSGEDPYRSLSFAAYKTSTATPDYLARAFLYNYEKASRSTENDRARNAMAWANKLT